MVTGYLGTAWVGDCTLARLPACAFVGGNRFGKTTRNAHRPIAHESTAPRPTTKVQAFEMVVPGEGHGDEEHGPFLGVWDTICPKGNRYRVLRRDACRGALLNELVP